MTSSKTPSKLLADSSRLTPGIHEMQLQGSTYFLAAPECEQVDQVIVLVHGVSRNVKGLIESFWPLIRKSRIALLAPRFDVSNYRDFQRLGRSGKGPRADLALIAMLSELKLMTGWPTDKVLMFGHSAGAQFVQRFLFAHPNRVIKAALSAAGCYTFPVNRNYPAGIQISSELPGVHFEPQRFLRIPTAVFIGLEDTLRDESLNRSRRVDKQQGTTRLERARRWVQAMQKASAKHGLKRTCELFEITGVCHDYPKAVSSAQLNQWVFVWLQSL